MGTSLSSKSCAAVFKPTKKFWNQPQRSWNPPLFFLIAWKRSRCTPSSNACVFFPIRDMFFSIFPNHKNPRPGSPRTWAPRPLHEGRDVKNQCESTPEKGPSIPKRKGSSKQHGFQGLPIYVSFREGSRWLYILLFYESKDSCHFSNKDEKRANKNPV